MRYLFVIQGEGRGHLTQALSMKEALEGNGHMVVEMMVGISKQRSLPKFFLEKAGAPITTFRSPNFLPTAANKRCKIGKSVLYNVACLPQFVKSMHTIHEHIRQSEADVVVNFYELLVGLLYGVTSPDAPYYCIGHQYMFLRSDYEFPEGSRINQTMLRLFTRLTSLRCKKRLALSFRDADSDESQRVVVVPPLLRNEVLNSTDEEGDFILGYIVNSGYADEVMAYHSRNPQVKMHFFWDKKNAEEETWIDETLCFHKINDKKFIDYMKRCRGYATTAGFESVCEAIYFGKPVMMVPVHIEQDCNAQEASRLGAGTSCYTFSIDELLHTCDGYERIGAFRYWAQSARGRIVAQLTSKELLRSEKSRWISAIAERLWID